MSALMDFLKAVGNREVFCCQWYAEDGDRMGLTGKVLMYDDIHVAIQHKKKITLIRVDDISEITFEPKIGIVVPS